MKVNAWQACDGSLHLTELDQKLHNARLTLKTEIRVLSSGAAHGLKDYDDWNARALTEDDLPEFFAYIAENYTEAMTRLVEAVREVRGLVMDKTRHESEQLGRKV